MKKSPRLTTALHQQINVFVDGAIIRVMDATQKRQDGHSLLTGNHKQLGLEMLTETFISGMRYRFWQQQCVRFETPLLLLQFWGYQTNPYRTISEIGLTCSQ